MKVEKKNHNGVFTKALRLTKAEIYKNGPSKKYCISHITIAIYEVDIDNKMYHGITLTNGHVSHVTDKFRAITRLF